MFKETTEAFDSAQTHDWQVSTDHGSDALPTAPCHLYCFKYNWVSLLWFTGHKTFFVGRKGGLVSKTSP